MAPSAELDHRMTSIKPRLKYNTIGGINGPLVILDNVRRRSLEKNFLHSLSLRRLQTFMPRER